MEATSTAWYAQAMEQLVSIVQRLSMARDLPSVMQVVRSAARGLTGADGATFVLREGETCFYADEEAIAPLWKGQRFPLAACISGWAMLNRQPAVIEDIYADPRIPHDAYRPTFVKSLVMMPIRTLDPIGAIGVYWAERRRPTDEEVRILSALADTTAVAIENVNLLADLENRVRVRTAELEEANRDLESFSQSVSHDLRAPLRAIDGFCALMAADHAEALDAEAMRKLGIIRAEAGRMKSLIEDLLSFARGGRAALQPCEVDMRALAAQVFDRLAAERGSAPTLKLGALPPAVADPSLIEQVWFNLLDNALKFTARRSEPLIEVSGRVEDRELVYAVRDNGAGFEPRYADKLFRPFQRLHSDAEFTGTGVGLALVQRIVGRHGGRISAESAPDRGATFTFSLPRAAH